MESKCNLKSSRTMKEKCRVCRSQERNWDSTRNKSEGYDFENHNGRCREKLRPVQTNNINYRNHHSNSNKGNTHTSIEIRNARERNRVQAVNEAFARLRKTVPYTAKRNKRVSKVKVLRKAVQYIQELEMLLLQGSCMH